MSNFDFFQTEWPAVHDAASRAEALVYPEREQGDFSRVPQRSPSRTMTP